MAFRLKRAVMVAADPGRDDYEPNQMVELPAGTPLSKIADSERAQLAPAHFVDDSNPDKLPEDWRPKEVRARDEATHKALDAVRKGEGE